MAAPPPLYRRRTRSMSRKSITNLVVTHGEAGLTQYGRVFSEEDEANYEQSIRAAEIARRNEARAKGIRFKPRLYRFEELPAFLRDNEFIRSGYRVFYSYADNWASMLMIHNETGNIWTHFLGFLWCLGLMISQYRLFPDFATFGDYFIFVVFCVCAQSCFLFSTLFHTHFCHSKWAFVKFGCLDYAGISSMICGSCCIVTYFAFYCQPFYRNIYLTFTVLCSCVGILGPFKEKWAHRSFRKWRTIIYTASAFSSAFPLAHYFLFHTFPDDVLYDFIRGIALMAFLYLFGALIYATRVPERYFPGKCDILFHSHQFWHGFVISAWYTHHQTALRLMEWRIQPNSCSAMS